jgi:hypothetical protein
VNGHTAATGCGSIMYEASGHAVDCGTLATSASLVAGGVAVTATVAWIAFQVLRAVTAASDLVAVVDAAASVMPNVDTAREAASLAGERFGLALDTHELAAVADAYSTTSENLAPFVVGLAHRMLPVLRAEVAAHPDTKIAFLGRDGEALRVAMSALDTQFMDPDAASAVVSRTIGEAALRDREKFLGAELLKEPFRREIGDVDVRRDLRRLTDYWRDEMGFSLDRPDSRIILVDSSFKGTVPAMLAAMFPQTRFSAHLIWRGQVEASLPPNLTIRGYLEEAPPGSPGSVAEIRIFEHLLRGALSSPTGFGPDDRPAQHLEHESPNPLGRVDPDRVSDRFQSGVVRDVVRAANQRAVADTARAFAAAQITTEDINARVEQYRELAQRWWDGSGEIPADLRELLDSFVPRD